jgi:transcriptional regulator with XRE-family HTH domain
MYVGKQLKKLRQGLDFSQEGFATAIGVSQSYYSSVERSKKPITNKILTTIAEKWGVKLDWFEKDFPSLSAYNMGVNNGGINGGIIISGQEKNRKEAAKSSTARESKQLVYARKLKAYLDKNPDIRDFEHAATMVFGSEYIISEINKKYFDFTMTYGNLDEEQTIDEYIDSYWKGFANLMPYKDAFIHLSEALDRFYKEMYQAGDTYFEFAKED